MSTTLISTDTITVATTFNFTTAGQQLVVLPNTVLASTASAAVGSWSYNDLGVLLLGTGISDGIIAMSGNNNLFHIAATGTYVSTHFGAGNAALFDATDSNTGTRIINEGSVTSLSTIAIVAQGNTSIVNSGIISAGSSAVFMGLFGANGDSLTNSGTITGGLQDNGAANPRLDNGVHVEGTGSRVVNLAGGVITTVATNYGTELPGGVEYYTDISGARLRNYGEISSVNGVGIDLNDVTAATNVSLINFGVVSGAQGSYRADLIGLSNSFTNRGLMDGDMLFLGGDDSFDNRNGTVEGNVAMGTGNDFYNGRLDARVNGGIYGDAGNDTIYGGDNEDLIVGGDDNDDLRGYGGDDRIEGESGDDTMLGNDGDDELIGGNGNDSLFGGRGNDVLNGGNENDRINGGDGDDRIIAGGGADILYGDDGADTFIFAAVSDSGLTGSSRDRIFDFDQAEGDIVSLSSIDANDNIGGNQVFSYIGSSAFSGAAGQLRYGTNGMIEGDTNGDGNADFQILLTNAPTLTVDAFIL